MIVTVIVLLLILVLYLIKTQRTQSSNYLNIVLSLVLSRLRALSTTYSTSSEKTQESYDRFHYYRLPEILVFSQCELGHINIWPVRPSDRTTTFPIPERLKLTYWASANSISLRCPKEGCDKQIYFELSQPCSVI